MLRLPCGSLRTHSSHEWTGQSDGRIYTCPGHSHVPVPSSTTKGPR